MKIKDRYVKKSDGLGDIYLIRFEDGSLWEYKMGVSGMYQREEEWKQLELSDEELIKRFEESQSLRSTVDN